MSEKGEREERKRVVNKHTEHSTYELLNARTTNAPIRRRVAVSQLAVLARAPRPHVALVSEREHVALTARRLHHLAAKLNQLRRVVKVLAALTVQILAETPHVHLPAVRDGDRVYRARRNL